MALLRAEAFFVHVPFGARTGIDERMKLADDALEVNKEASRYRGCANGWNNNLPTAFHRVGCWC